MERRKRTDNAQQNGNEPIRIIHQPCERSRNNVHRTLHKTENRFLIIDEPIGNFLKGRHKGCDDIVDDTLKRLFQRIDGIAEIIGGIGWIFGLVGVAAYFKSRPRV